MPRRLGAPVSVGEFLLNYRPPSAEFGGYPRADSYEHVGLRATKRGQTHFLFEAMALHGYQLLELLASDESGYLFRATHPDIDSTVAVRMIPKPEFVDAGAVQEFLGEARRHVLWTREPFVRILDVGESDYYCFVVMEYFESASLAEVLSYKPEIGHRFSLTDAVRHGISLCEACLYARDESVNLQIDTDRVLVQGQVIRLSDRAFLRPRLRANSEEFAAREVTREFEPYWRASSERSDGPMYLRGVGLVLFALLAGEEPPVSGAPLSTLRRGIPRPLQELVTRLVATCPRESPWDVREILYGVAVGLSAIPAEPWEEVDQVAVSLDFANPPCNVERAGMGRAYRRIAALLLTTVLLSATTLGGLELARRIAATPHGGAGLAPLVRHARTSPIQQEGNLVFRGASRHRGEIFVGSAFPRPKTPAEFVQRGQLDPPLVVASYLENRALSRYAWIFDRSLSHPLPMDTEEYSLPNRGRLGDMNGRRSPRAEMGEVSWKLDMRRRSIGDEFDGLALEERDSRFRVDLAAGDGRLANLAAMDEEWLEIPEDAEESTGHLDLSFAVETRPIMEFVIARRTSAPAPLIDDMAATPEADAPVELVVQDPPKPRVEIGPITFRHLTADQRKGLELQFAFRAEANSEERVEVGAYFSDAKGIRLEDRDGQYVSLRGHVYAKRVVQLGPEQSDTRDLMLFLPYTQFDGLGGGPHRLQAQVFVWAGPNFDRRIGNGTPQNFALTLYKFNAASSRKTR